MEPLQTRAELNAKLDQIRKNCYYVYYGTLLVLCFINLWSIILILPLWFVVAAVYTQIDNHYEAKYLNAVLERKKQVQNKW